MNRPTTLSAALVSAVLVLTVTACGGDSDAPQVRQTASNGDVFTGADVDFATAMIPHHAQALVMVDLTRGRDLSPEVAQLAEQILATQGLEIEQMVDWLTEWGEPIPETSRDHVNAHGHGSEESDGHDADHDDAAMPGMMSEAEMADLVAARGAEFETLWLQLMIEHHEGAVEMAEEQQEDGVFRPAVTLAKAIEAAQREEIDLMEELLDS